MNRPENIIFNKEDASMCICLNKSCFVVPWPSCVQLFASPWTAARQASLSLTISQSLPKFIPLNWWSHPTICILCCPLLLLPSIFPTIRVFSNESAVHIRWPKYWNFSFSFSLFKEYSVLITFKIDWFEFLAFQGTLKSLLQHYSLKASILWHSASLSGSHIHTKP